MRRPESGVPPSQRRMRALAVLEGLLIVKNRNRFRGMAAATGVLVASGALTVGMTSWAAEPDASAVPVVTRIGPLPDGAEVRRDGPPAGEHLTAIKDKQRRQAARAAKKAAAAERAKRAREAQQQKERASRSAPRQVSSTGNPPAIASGLAASRYGWGADQFSCLNSLWMRESGWNLRATNPSSGAYGIPQALPGSKMSAYGSDWRSSARTQIEWGLSYIKGTYGSPCGAWSAFQSKGWY